MWRQSGRGDSLDESRSVLNAFRLASEPCDEVEEDLCNLQPHSTFCQQETEGEGLKPEVALKEVGGPEFLQDALGTLRKIQGLVNSELGREVCTLPHSFYIVSANGLITCPSCWSLLVHTSITVQPTAPLENICNIPRGRKISPVLLAALSDTLELIAKTAASHRAHQQHPYSFIDS